jgi:hypothetical protein
LLFLDLGEGVRLTVHTSNDRRNDFVFGPAKPNSRFFSRAGLFASVRGLPYAPGQVFGMKLTTILILIICSISIGLSESANPSRSFAQSTLSAAPYPCSLTLRLLIFLGEDLAGNKCFGASKYPFNRIV